MIFYDFYYGILVERIFLWFLWFFTCHICGNGFCSFLFQSLMVFMVFMIFMILNFLFMQYGSLMQRYPGVQVVLGDVGTAPRDAAWHHDATSHLPASHFLPSLEISHSTLTSTGTRHAAHICNSYRLPITPPPQNIHYSWISLISTVDPFESSNRNTYCVSPCQHWLTLVLSQLSAVSLDSNIHLLCQS